MIEAITKSLWQHILFGFTVLYFFTALTLYFVWKEGHPACKSSQVFGVVGRRRSMNWNEN